MEDKKYAFIGAVITCDEFASIIDEFNQRMEEFTRAIREFSDNMDEPGIYNDGVIIYNKAWFEKKRRRGINHESYKYIQCFQKNLPYQRRVY